MEEKLKKLYKECLDELKLININLNENDIGKIDIAIAKRKAKRYGCCKQEQPDKSTSYRKGKRTYYSRYQKHHIEISSWVMELNDEIIKNTIIHEIIHCLPYCNNHGKKFKEYSYLINQKLGYNISRLGNKQEDYEKSNLEYIQEKIRYKYIIICKGCGEKYYRQRINKKFLRKYRCGNCKGKLRILN